MTLIPCADILPTMSDPTIEDQSKEWRFYHSIEVRFADIDMFGHLNNAKYLTYIESARVAYFTAVTGQTNPLEFNMTVASVKMDFLQPVFYGQTVYIYTRAGRIGNKSWTLEHELRNSATGDLLAVASTVNVYFVHKTGQSMPIPEEIMQMLERFEGRKLRS